MAAGRIPKKKVERRTFYGFELDRRGRFNGQLPSHWIARADELVMRAIVRGINPDKNSIAATIAVERLTNLAKALNPVLFQQVLDERMQCVAAIPQIIDSMLGWGAPKGVALCPKHARLGKRVRKALRNEAKATKTKTKTKTCWTHSVRPHAKRARVVP